MKVGDRLNIWIVGDGPLKYRAQVESVHPDGYVGTLRVVSSDGQHISDTVLQRGQFVVIDDQSVPEHEVA